jgi:hypothetical protein
LSHQFIPCPSYACRVGEDEDQQSQPSPYSKENLKNILRRFFIATKRCKQSSGKMVSRVTEPVTWAHHHHERRREYIPRGSDSVSESEPGAVQREGEERKEARRKRR